MRSSITLFDDQYKLYKTGSKKLLIAFVEYMFEGIEPDLKPSEMAIFNSLRERMDNSNKAHDGRSKGGKNSHGGPTGKSDEKGTKNEPNLNEKGTKNGGKMNENGIQDTKGELESSNSGTTAIKRKKEEEDIYISTKVDIEQNSSLTKDINNLIDTIKQQCDTLGVAYDKQKDRYFAKFILSAKEYGGFCEKVGMDRAEFAVNVLIASVKIKFRKGFCTGPMKIYQNYADVYNETLKQHSKNQKNLIQSF